MRRHSDDLHALAEPAGRVEKQEYTTGGSPRFRSGLFRGRPAYEPRSPWGAGRALLAVGGIVALSIVPGLLLMLADQRGIDLGGGQGPGHEALVSLRFFALWQVATILLTLVASCLFRGRIPDVLALHRAGGWRIYLGALVTMAVLQLALSGVQYLTNPHDLYADLRPFVELVRGPHWMLAAAVIGIGAPLSEELLFRGFLLSALAKTRLGFWGAAFISTALWTSLHVGYTAIGIIEVLLIGLFFSWLLWRTGSLRVPIFCHAAYNTLIVLSLRLVDLPGAG
jgi:membrane protease YdiL (CAAX protease family)